MYDSQSLKEALTQEDFFHENKIHCSRQDVAFVVGQICIPVDHVLGWADIYRRSTDIETVKKEGFDAVEVFTSSQGEVICPWTRERFEEHYNVYVERLEHYENTAKPYPNVVSVATGVSHTTIPVE